MCKKKKILIIEDDWNHYVQLVNLLMADYQLYPEINTSDQVAFETFICELRVSLDNRSVKKSENILKVQKKISLDSIDSIILDYELQPQTQSINADAFRQTYLKNIEIPILFFTQMTKDPRTNNYLNVDIIEKKNTDKGKKIYDMLSKTKEWSDGTSCYELNEKILQKVENLLQSNNNWRNDDGI